jgi:hypothetical protein
MKIKAAYIFLMIILFVSCQKKITNLEFEKNVMTEILPGLIDSTCIDARIYLNPPPPYGKTIFDNTGHYVGIDSTKATKEEKQERLDWKNNLDSIKRDTSKIIVAFDPKIKKKNENVKQDFEKHFKGAKIFNSKEESQTEYILDFKNIKLKNKFQLKNISEFPKDRDLLWKTKYNFVFSGVAFFSRIQFDKEKKFGILDGGFVCGGLCGQGFRIYIKKINNKWIIDEVEGTWIS